jgi:hypothetical protein
VNDITSVVIDADGNYSQHHLGFFPELVDDEQNRLRFGANAEFFRAPGIDAYENNVIQLDAISGETVLGHIFGGIMTNGPHTRQGADSAASSLLFEVVLIPVPEPATGVLLLACGTAIALGRGRPRA